MSLNLFRTLFPRWSFFDDVSTALRLEAKAASSNRWEEIPFAAARSVGGFFVNPEVTRLHAEMSLIENFVQDLATLTEPDGQVSSADLEKLTSYKMIRSLVASRVLEAQTTDLKFRISKADGTLIFVSDVIEPQ